MLAGSVDEQAAALAAYLRTPGTKESNRDAGKAR